MPDNDVIHLYGIFDECLLLDPDGLEGTKSDIMHHCNCERKGRFVSSIIRSNGLLFKLFKGTVLTWFWECSVYFSKSFIFRLTFSS